MVKVRFFLGAPNSNQYSKRVINMAQFKVGDSVYWPNRGTTIYTIKLTNRSHSNNYPLSVADWDLCFTVEGKTNSTMLPVLFHATPENKAALETLYGIAFEDLPLVGSALTKQKLTESRKPILCYCSDFSDKAALDSNIVCLIANFRNDINCFLCIAGTEWKYAVPYTGEIQND
jgi:hypothetical protein